MSVVILTTGVPGCGKTYVRCARFLVDDFLPEQSGIHYSNFPIDVDVVADVVSRRMSSKSSFLFGRKPRVVSPDDVKARIRVIPDVILQAWKNEQSGPWDYFEGVDLKYAHIAIDEIHNFMSNMHSLEHLKKWDEFLGEVRHRGCTFEGLTQSASQVSNILTRRAGVCYELVPAEDLRDPYFHIPMLDWYNLKAAFLGHLHKTVFMVEKRLQGRTWKTNHTSRFFIVPEYFKYYHSFNASLSEKESGVSDEGRAVQYEYEKRGRISLLFWFIRRNFLSLFWRIGLVSFIVWCCFFGGGLNFFHYFMDIFTGAVKNSTPKPSSSVSKVVDSNLDPSGFNDIPIDNDYLSGSGAGSRVPKGSATVPPFDSSGFLPVCFYDDNVWLKNGIKIYIGYVFKEGAYNEKSVTQIDFEERCYYIDDDICIYMP